MAQIDQHGNGPAKGISDRAAIAIVAVLLLSLGGGIAWLLTWKPGLSACEDAIKETLKAPATYQRVKVEGSSPLYTITYDAENSFGVPLRGSGFCNVNGAQASWFEDYHPDAGHSDD